MIHPEYCQRIVTVNVRNEAKMVSCRSMSVVGYSAIILFWGVVSACNAAAVSEQQLIISKFPSYHILKNNELDKETFQYYQKNYDGSQAGIVKTDIDGNGVQDIAALLKADGGSSTKFVILLCDASSSCSVTFELDTSPHQQIYITRVKAGTLISQTEAIDTPVPSVKLVHDGIRLTYFEKAEMVFFRDDKLHKISSIQTAD